jgi:hypothetical protein
VAFSYLSKRPMGYRDQRGVRRGTHGGRRYVTAQERKLSEEVTGTEVSDCEKLSVLARHLRVQEAAFDHIEAIDRLASLDDYLVLAHMKSG